MTAALSVVTLSLTVVLTVGYLGYYAFGNTVKSVIVYNFPNEDPVSILIKICYLFTISGSYVIVIQPVFHVLESTSWYKVGKCGAELEEDGDDDTVFSFCDWCKYFLVRTLVVVILFFISIAIPNINILMTISGALCGTLVNFYLPVLFYNRAYNT